MATPLRKSTAGQVVQFTMVSSTDFLTPKTGLSIANTDIKLIFEAGTTQTSKNSGGATEIGSTGTYYMTLDATDTATLGRLHIDVQKSGALPWFKDTEVLPALVWDALYASSGGAIMSDLQTVKTQTVTCAAGVTVAAFVGNATAALAVDASGRVDIGKVLGTAIATPATAGVIDVNVKNVNNVAATSVTTINANIGTTQPVNFTGTGASALAKSDMVDVAGSAVSASAAQIGVNVVNFGGSAGTFSGGVPAVNVTKLNGSTTAAASFAAAYGLPFVYCAANGTASAELIAGLLEPTVVKLGPTDHNWDDNAITVPAGVQVYGCGMGVTRIISSANSTNGAVVALSDNVGLFDLSVIGTATTPQVPVGFISTLGNTPATNVLIERVEVVGDSDGFFFDGGSGARTAMRITLRGCRARTKYDCCIMFGNVAYADEMILEDNDFSSAGPSVADPTPATARCVIANSCAVRFLGGGSYITGGSVTVNRALAGDANGIAEIHGNPTLYAYGTNAESVGSVIGTVRAAGSVNAYPAMRNTVTPLPSLAIATVTTDVAGKVLGGGSGTISGTGVRAVDGSGNALATASATTAIQAKTDTLPTSPAATGDAMTLTGAYDAAKTAASQASVTALPAAVRDVSNSSPAAGSLGEAARNADAKAATLIQTIGTPQATIAEDIAGIDSGGGGTTRNITDTDRQIYDVAL